MMHKMLDIALRVSFKSHSTRNSNLSYEINAYKKNGWKNLIREKGY